MRPAAFFLAALAVATAAFDPVSLATPTPVPSPTVNLLSVDVVSPTAAWSYYGSATTHTNGPGAWTATPPEIKSLARALGGAGRLSADQFAQNVFDYVRNNIDVEFRFGLGKGGRGALLDQSGTAFDQVDLMIRLLREGGVTANYQIGTIALSAQQFGQWTGLVTNLNQSLQTFDVDARAACQYLADGGIPAIVNGASSCTGLSGNLSTTGPPPVQMLHIWVSANGKLYDPSFKAYLLKTGVDVSVALGCGTATSPTCGSGMVTAGMSGATTGTDGTGNYIQNFNGAGLSAKLQTYATTLQSYIQGTDRLASIRDIVGGPLLTITPSPVVSGILPYVTTTDATWTQIPDKFRTTLRVRVGSIYPEREPSFSNGAPVDQTFFADDIAGRRLQVLNGSSSMALIVDSSAVPTSACPTCGTGSVTLDVDHPYAANSGSYGDETISFGMPGVSTDYTTGALPITIVHEFGNASQATDQHIGAYQETNPTAIGQGVTLINGGTGSGGFVMQSSYENNNQAVLAGKLLGQGSAADRVIGGLGQARVTRHHDVGVIYAAPYDPSSTSYLSLSTAMSVNTASFASVLRGPVFETEAATWAMLEGEVNAQVQGMKNGLWAGLFLAVSMVHQTGTTTTGALTASVGALGYSPTSLAYTMYGAIKGGGSLQSDPLHVALDTVKINEMAANRKKYLSVSPADGSASLTITDIVTGTGSFPESLPFQRTYRSGAMASDRVVASYSTTDNGNDDFVGSNSSTAWRYSGPDSAANSHLGGGWNHNFNVTASYSADSYKAFGSETALDASASIAALWSFMDAARNPVFANRLAMIFDGYWLSHVLAFNSVVIDKGGQTEVFQRLPDGTFDSLSGSSRLVQSGESQVNSLNGTEDFTPVTFLYTGKDGHTIDFDWMHQNMHPYATGWTVSSADPVFKANHWNFPDGTKVTFTYSGQWLATMIGAAPISCGDSGFCLPGPAGSYPWGYVLTGVSNNRGRSLTFTVVPRTATVVAPDPRFTFNISTSFQITRVTDETGRHVDYALSDCPAAGDGQPNRLLCGTFAVTGPDSTVTKYTYNLESDGTGNQASSYRLNAWYSPSNLSAPYQTLGYDDIFHTKIVTDILGHATSYYPGSVTAIDLWKRGDVVTPMGFNSTSTFDRWNSLLSSTNPLGATTAYSYDNARRKILETAPEGNSSAFAYDARSNLLSTTAHAKPGSALADIVTSSTYVEGPGVLVCTNPLTCNKQATSTNGRGYVTTFSWDSSSGQLTQIKSGLNGALSCQLTGGVCPQTDLSYTSFSGTDGSSLKLLTGKTEKVSSSASVLTSYAYDTSNKFVLQSASVDPLGLNLTTSLTFDTLGNLTAVDGPRTDVIDVTNYTWDANRRLTFVIQPDADGAGPHPRPATKYLWDLDGQLIETDRGTTTSSTGSDFVPTLATLFAYDAAGNRTGESTPTRVTQFSYDADDRRLCTAVRMNPAVFGSLPSDACTLSTTGTFGDDRITKIIYDTAGETLQELRGFGTSIAQTYATNTWTPNGKLASVYDADGAAHGTNFTYDGFDRPYTTTFADGSFERVTLYDADGNEQTRLNRSGQSFSMTYDALDRLTGKVVPAAETVPANTITTQYDLLGHVTVVSDTNGNTLANDYDLAGRLKSASRTTPTLSSKVVSYQYDQAGNRTQLAWPDGYHADYNYDALNHPTVVTASTGLTLATYSYDDLGRRKSIQYAGGSGATVSYDWSPEDDLKTLSHDLAGSGSDVTFTNTFNPAHQWASSVVSNASYDFQPPALASATYAPNVLNQYDTVGGLTQAYDTRGNLTTDGVRSFTYDAENRLIAMTTGPTSSYAYDPLGRRSTKTGITFTGPLWGGVSWGAFNWTPAVATTNFVHDGDSEIGEYDSSGNLLRRFVPGPSIDEYVAMVSAGGVTSFFHSDKMGSVIAMSDTAGVLTEGPFTYDPYGSCFQNTSSCTNAGVPFRYTGQRFDPEIGLHYYRARYYSSTTGRFLQTDPVGYKSDLNLYTYVGNDPTDMTDPSGKDPFTDPMITNMGYALMQMNGVSPAQVQQLQAIDNQAHMAASLAIIGISAAAACGAGGCAAVGLAIASRAPEATMGAVAITGVLAETPMVGPSGAAVGGRLGSSITRAHVADVADKMESRGWTITGGGGRLPEEYLPGPGGGRAGSSFPDITAVKNGNTLRVNTVDTLSNGVTPTAREAANAARIRAQTPGDHLLLVPKPKP